VLVLLERTGQQPGLGQHLEAVADPDDGPAVCCEAGDGAMTGEKRAIAPGRR